MRILVVVAHPDDEVLGCGGTIARLASEGNEVYIGILGEGITSRYPAREQADERLIEALRTRSRRVAELLGARDLLVHHLPDNRFDTVPLLDVVKIVEQLMECWRPQVIYTHHGGDLNIDHGVVHRAVLTAARPVAGCPVKEIYAFEVPSSTEWTFASLGVAFEPNVFMNINATLETKLAAMELYDSEIRPFPFPRSREALLSIARRWGAVAGLPSAEAFRLVRSVR